jgi:hypothetical protein
VGRGRGRVALGRQVAQATGAQTDRAGRVVVQPDLTLPGHPEISVIGDLASAQSHVPGREPTPVPGVSPGAKQMGRTAAANILRRLMGQPGQPFRYADYGNLATIGRNSAVVDLTSPVGAGALFRLLCLAVLAVCARVLFDRLSQPAGGADGLGLGVLELCAVCAGGDGHHASAARPAFAAAPGATPTERLNARLNADSD